MSERHEDELLRDRFQAVRRAQAGHAPDFRAMIDRARTDAEEPGRLHVIKGGSPDQSRTRVRRRRLVFVGGWASAAVAAAITGLLLVRPSAEDREFVRLVSSFSAEAAAAGRQSPTSRLLAVPGIELVNSVPSVGGSLLETSLPGTATSGSEGRS